MEWSKNIYDKIGSLILGYCGYAEHDGRRNCDKLLRNKIAGDIAECETVLNNRLKMEIKNIDLLQELEESRQQFNTLSDKIKYATYGESSFFENFVQSFMTIYSIDYCIETVDINKSVLHTRIHNQ